MSFEYSEEQQVFLMSQLVFSCFLMKLVIKIAEWLIFLVGDTLCEEFSPHVAIRFSRRW